MTKIENLKAAIETLRVTIAALKADLSTLTRQARSRREVNMLIEKRVSAWHAQASADVAIDLQRLLAGQPGDLLSVRAPHGLMQMGPWLAVGMGEAAMVAWLQSLTRGMPEGLDAPERAARIAELSRELTDAEAAEEALLREADDLGHPLDPRPDADPRAAVLLEIAP